MKKNMTNQLDPNESLVSKIFTKEELEVLNFSEAELATLDEAEAVSKMIDMCPQTDKELDAFDAHFDKVFPDDLNECMNILQTLPEKDPKFMQQLVALCMVMNEVKPEPVPATEKVSVDSIKQLKENLSNEEKRAQYAEILKQIEQLDIPTK